METQRHSKSSPIASHDYQAVHLPFAQEAYAPRFGADVPDLPDQSRFVAKFQSKYLLVGIYAIAEFSSNGGIRSRAWRLET